MFLHGPAGTGKTCAILALHDHAGGLYYTVEQFVGEALMAMRGELDWSWRDRSKVTEATFWVTMANTPLLSLDDLGTRNPSDATYDRIKRAIDCRDGKPLIVSSNHDLAHLARIYDDRIASRLAAGTVVLVSGKDRRLQR